MPESLDLIVVRNFAIALLIGALVGIEREKKKLRKDEVSVGGIRTFMLFAQAGAVAAWLSQQFGSPWIFVATLVAVSATVVAGYITESKSEPAAIGLTTELAAIVVCLLGGATVFGHAEVAVGLAITTSAILAFKQPLHGLVEKLGTEDIYAGLKLLIATFIVLPILPDRAIDPWDAINPYKLWWLVILISSLSLVGYVTVRWLGTERGTAITGMTGGLVSSTAVSLTFSRRSRDEASVPGIDNALACGILLAWSVMFVRIVAEVAVVFAPLLTKLLIPFAAMAFSTLLLAILFFRNTRQPHRKEAEPTEQLVLNNPFSLSAAIRFALFFAGVMFVVQLVKTNFPGEGLYVVAGLAGLTDVDAITLSMADHARTSGDHATAVTAIAIAALTNTLVKCVLIAVLGSRGIRLRTLAATAVILASGAVSLLLM
ncbi:MAG: MgtC/SapB family protein [Planctomycetales bacterium]|nr:MgtC/SapB family protein [Planctomycetales bacterium]